MAHYFMVRARGNEAEYNIANEVVAVGWSNVDFSKTAPQDLSNALVNARYNDDWQAHEFKRIAVNDYILMPTNRGIAICRATGVEQHDQGRAIPAIDRANQHKVEFIKDADGNVIFIPRPNFSHDLQNKLAQRGATASGLDSSGPEIEDFIQDTTTSYIARVRRKELKEAQDFQDELLDRIQTAQTGLEARGSGLESLVKNLLKCDSYEIVPVPQWIPGGDVDIMATREDDVLGTTQKIIVQVKHYKGIAGPDGIQQLVTAKGSNPYRDCQAVFVTSADAIDAQAQALATANNIIVITGKDLVRIIYQNLYNLDPETRYQLGIMMVPRLF